VGLQAMIDWHKVRFQLTDSFAAKMTHLILGCSFMAIYET